MIRDFGAGIDEFNITYPEICFITTSLAVKLTEQSCYKMQSLAYETETWPLFELLMSPSLPTHSHILQMSVKHKVT